MSSMTNLEKVTGIVTAQADVVLSEVIDAQQVAFELKQTDVHKVLSVLKSAGWKQLSYLSAVDWPDENKMEVVYVLFNWEEPVYVQIRTKIDRENPVMDTILPIFPGAQYYEREAHEFFGISFPGNPDHKKQLILEEWDDIPPLRKDFNPRDYSDKKYTKREYPDVHANVDENNKKEEKRAERDRRAAALRTGGQK